MVWTVFWLMLQVSQTVLRSQQRTQIAIPAQGMIEFRDALTDLLDEFGTDDHGQCHVAATTANSSDRCWWRDRVGPPAGSGRLGALP